MPTKYAYDTATTRPPLSEAEVAPPSMAMETQCRKGRLLTGRMLSTRADPYGVCRAAAHYGCG